MSMSADAHVYYGYDLGESHRWKLTQYDQKTFTLKLPSLYEDGEDGFSGRIAELLADSGLPVEIIWHGTLDSSSYAVVIKDVKISADCGEGTLLDTAQMTARPVLEDWNFTLATALKALEITPTQERPGWLLVCRYG